jgi:hypothetical protein
MSADKFEPRRMPVRNALATNTVTEVQHISSHPANGGTIGDVVLTCMHAHF